MTAIQHVALEVPRPRAEDEVAFWALLGFAEVPPPKALRGRFRWVQREGDQVHLALLDEPVIPPHGHVAVVARHLEQLKRALDRGGHPWEDRAPHWGADRLYVTSPAGHTVEAMAFPPA